MNWINKKLVKRIFWYREQNKELREQIDYAERFAGKMVEQRDWAFKEMKELNFELNVLRKTIKD